MIRRAEAAWRGDLQSGSGKMRLGSGAFEGSYSFKTRMENESGTNPEELIGAAHAACYSMAFSAMLAAAGHKPEEVRTSAKVHFGPVEGGFAIGRIELSVDAKVPGIDPATFLKLAEEAKKGCPVSKALASVEIELDARLGG